MTAVCNLFMILMVLAISTHNQRLEISVVRTRFIRKMYIAYIDERMRYNKAGANRIISQCLPTYSMHIANQVNVDTFTIRNGLSIWVSLHLSVESPCTNIHISNNLSVEHIKIKQNCWQAPDSKRFIIIAFGSCAYLFVRFCHAFETIQFLTIHVCCKFFGSHCRWEYISHCDLLCTKIWTRKKHISHTKFVIGYIGLMHLRSNWNVCGA